jgi:acetolactate synthase-1/2/3 large subunit
MAEAYGRVTGRPGVTIVTTGPGAAGTIIGLQEAYGSSTPLFVIMSEIASDYIGKSRGVLHETKDQLGLFSCVTAWSRRAESVEAIPSLIHEAFASMRSGRPRPCTLDIPLDILAASANVAVRSPSPQEDSPVDRENLQHLFKSLDFLEKSLPLIAERLLHAKRPILYAGGGVLSSGASSELQTLAELLRAPVLTSINGKGATPEDHPLSLGNWGMFEPIRGVVKESDAVLAVGTRFGNRATGRWAIEFAPDALMQIDVDPSEIGKNYPVGLGVVGDARGTLRYLISTLEGMSHPASSTFSQEQIAAWRDEVKGKLYGEGPAEMKLLDGIRAVLPRDAIIANDSTIITYWGRRSFPVLTPRTFLWPMGSGTIGYGLPAAVGAKVAYPDRSVIAICGDGGFIFSCQELSTAVRYRLAIPILLFNDEAYGVIGHYQRLRFRRDVDTDLVNPDFMKFADAFGVGGVQLDTLDDVAPALKEALSADRPTVIEVRAHLTPPSLI